MNRIIFNSSILLLLCVLSNEGIHGLKCFSCNGVRNPKDCKTTRQCYRNEICFAEKYFSITDYEIKWMMSCKDSAFCNAISSDICKTLAFKKRDVYTDTLLQKRSNNALVSLSCCSTDLCNNIDCSGGGNNSSSTTSSPMVNNNSNNSSTTSSPMANSNNNSSSSNTTNSFDSGLSSNKTVPQVG